MADEINETFSALQKAMDQAPGLLKQAEKTLEPAFISFSGTAASIAGGAAEKMSGMAAKVEEMASQAASSASRIAQSVVAGSSSQPAKSSSASLTPAPRPAPYPDAGGATMPAKAVEGTLLQPKEALANGYSLAIETIEDTFEKAIARYEYPYADGADLEDLGQRAHVLRVRCYFWDDAEQETYNHHILLVNGLASRALVDFVHPKYGLLKGKIESVVVRHDDRERCAEVDLTFVEQMRAALEPLLQPPLLSSLEAAYLQGQEEQQEKLAADVKQDLPKADAGAATKTLDSSLGLLEQVQGYSAKARSYVGKVEGYIATAEALVSQVTSPVDSLQATITYATSLPGRILGSITAAVEKVARTYDSLKNFPTRFLSALDDALDDLQDAFNEFGSDDTSTAGTSAGATMTNHLSIACAQRLALEAASLYSADETAFSEGGEDFQVMNMRELEETLALVRTRIEAAVGSAREMESLKIMAASLLSHVNRVRLEREKMIAADLDNPMPLHLVCLRHGLPYTDAERLLAVNRGIRNPNFTSGEVLVYVR